MRSAGTRSFRCAPASRSRGAWPPEASAMGLDVVMIGLDEIKEQVKTDVQVAAMVKWLQENIPETHTTHIGEPTGRMSEGDRVGLYSDLHVLRGLALRFERDGAAALADATEEDLQS